MPHDAYKALYIHLPFCVSRCAYCDFKTKSVKQKSKQIDRYIEHLCLEIRRAAKEGELSEIETVYIGGGTPSHAGMSRLSMLLYTLSTSIHLTPEVECTMEANPESLDASMVRDIWALGVNRISIGVQSFDDTVLETLGRAHSSEDARRAIAAAKERFDNVSIDLMCGIPGQTLESFEDSVREALKLGVTHVSIYPLTIEAGTKFEKLMRAGKLEIPDEDLAADQMEAAERILSDAGFKRYEVASYAKPGYESRHNISYWTGKPYIGFGDSAVTMTQNDERRMRVQDGHVIDDLDERQMLAEDLMLGTRMSEGVSDDLVQKAQDAIPETVEVLKGLEARGLISRTGNRWCPTERGWLCGNELYGALLELAP